MTYEARHDDRHGDADMKMSAYVLACEHGCRLSRAEDVSACRTGLGRLLPKNFCQKLQFVGSPSIFSWRMGSAKNQGNQRPKLTRVAAAVTHGASLAGAYT